jgi:hypothetical protein
LREFVAEPITIEGETLQRGDTRMLRIDPRSLGHTPADIEVTSGVAKFRPDEMR